MTVLMGERHAAHAFMPHALVFPGGAVDACDTRLACPIPLDPASEEKLLITPRGAKPKALALAAIRETFEETGLRLGSAGAGRMNTRSPIWQKFIEGQYTPAIDQLIFAARAITPPGLPRRYDTRFFAASAEALSNDPDDLSRASGELLNLRWIDVDEVLSSTAPAVTRRGLSHALAHFKAHIGRDSRPPVPFVRGTVERRIHEQI